MSFLSLAPRFVVVGLIPFALSLGCAPPTARPAKAVVPVTVSTAPQAPGVEGPEEEALGGEVLERWIAELRLVESSEAWGKRLDEIEARFGGPGLVQALSAAAPESMPERSFFQKKGIFNRIETLSDPRAADPLVAWVESTKPSMHWQGVAGLLLAEVGDPRAAPLLGERLKHAPDELYAQERFWEADEGGHLSRTDRPRVMAARLLSDLAVMRPDKVVEVRQAVEDGALQWLNDAPQPHANGLRLFANLRSPKALPLLREWAFPKGPLPQKGASPPFPAEIELAQSALRYIGAIHDEPSFPKLLAQLERKTDRSLDITQDALSTTNIAMLGMSLRALAFGASQGLAHFGDPRAVKPLMTFIEDETWHEEARYEAALALAWCADDAARASFVPKIKASLARGGPKAELVATLYLNVFIERPSAASAGLVDLLTNTTPVDMRQSAAEALAAARVEGATQALLEAKLADKALRVDAAVALLLGSSIPVARLVGMIDGFDPTEKAGVLRSVMIVAGRINDEDPTLEAPIRWAKRAEEAADIVLHGGRQTWMRDAVAEGLANIRFDNGPHSMTRPVLRYRLYRGALADAASRRGFVEVLYLMKERGTLMALAGSKTDAAAPAAKALGRMGKKG